jgi:hypothetical protein
VGGFVAGTAAGAGCAAGGREGGVDTGGDSGGSETDDAHAASMIAAAAAMPRLRRAALLQSSVPSWCPAMWLLLLEAALALGLLVFIVWWTMFHRPKRKPPRDG